MGSLSFFVGISLLADVEQNLFVCAVEYIVVSRDVGAEFFKLFPCVIDIELVRVSPDIEEQGLIRGVGKEFVGEVVEDIKIKMEGGGMQEHLILWQGEGACARRGTGILHTCILANQVGYAQIVVDTAAGICHTDNGCARDFFKGKSVLFNLTDYLGIVLDRKSVV